MGLRTLSFPIPHPLFLPDATYGVVRSLSSQDLKDIDIKGIVMNTFHLMQNPGSSTIKSLGGVHKMYDWDRLVVTDSGGFQAYSLIHQNPENGVISDRGISIKNKVSKRRLQLTPEKTIQLQIAYGSDLLITLDDCTHPEASLKVQEVSVSRTISWAIRGKKEYEKLINEKKMDVPPKIFSVIQGGKSLKLRKRCTEELLAVGFDGFGYGGWPIDESGSIISEIFEYIRELIPLNYPLHALGVGHPENIVKVFRLGWHIFDSALPTRDARRGRLYSFQEGLDFSCIQEFNQAWFKYIYISDKRHLKSSNPISEECDCQCCKHYSLGFLHHLFKQNDHLYYRLSTIHNLRYIQNLCNSLIKK